MSDPLPPVAAAFSWRSHAFGPVLTCEPLDRLASHFFTTRALPLSTADGWSPVASAIGVQSVRLFRLSQVHGADVVRVGQNDTMPSTLGEGDALITDDSDAALAVRAADCAPILMADRRTGAVAAAHAGWRGTAASVASAVVAAMADAFGTRASDLVVAIGPTIGSCCYEVGSELVDAFAGHGHARHLIDRWFLAPPPRRGERGRPSLRLDIAGANRDQFVLAGVPERDIHVSGLCTAMHLDVLTSFRVEGERAGRMAGVIRARGLRSR